MDDLFALLILISFIGLVIGLIKPDWVIKWNINKTRKNVLLYFGISLVVFFILFGLTHDETETKDEEKSITKTENKVQKNNALSEDVKAEAQEKSLCNPTQEKYINKKVGIFRKMYLNPKNEAQKRLYLKSTKEVTQEFLDSIDYTLENWCGEINMIRLAYGHTSRDKKLLREMSPNELVEKYPEGRDLNIWINSQVEIENSTFSLDIIQEHNPKKNLRGIKSNEELYDKLLSFSKGQKILFTAKVVDFEENKFESNIAKEHTVFFNVELRDVKPVDN